MKFLHFITFLLLISTNPLVAQEQTNLPIITGRVNRDSLLNSKDIKDWYVKGYNSYHPKRRVIKRIKSKYSEFLKLTRIDIFAGAWCSDTKRELPKAMKVFDALGLKAEQVELMFLNRKKIAERDPEVNRLANLYKVKSIPTFVVFGTNYFTESIGEIVEKVHPSFEKAFEKIIIEEIKHPRHKTIPD